MTTAAPCGPQELADSIVDFVARKSGISRSHVVPIVDAAIAEAGGDRAVERLQTSLARPADAWSYYPGDSLARIMHHRLAELVLPDPPTVTGADHLGAIGSRAIIIVANHLSYSDANVVELLLGRCGHAGIADRLAAIAGPKVYSDLGRRFSSLCFGTIKTPQNEGVSSGEAVMNARDVAVAARETLATAGARLALGDALLIFPEGSRSRTGGMQPFLAGVARYFEDDELLVVPVGLSGTEHMFAIGEERLGSARITMSIGPPFTAGSIRAITGDNRRRFVDVLGATVAAQLPTAYRGSYPLDEPKGSSPQAPLEQQDSSGTQ